MADNSIYTEIARRTGGDIYIGVVGPVRTGKSTFIERFVNTVVLPNIENEFDRERTQDVTPQSASGRTIMTTEPKFVPDKAVKIKVGETELNVKLIDCVGYMIDGALGAMENGETRMVMTPWRDEAVPFTEAAEIGTRKVISEHSTIGMLVTSDGSFGDLDRECYVEAEERVAKELCELGKPFAIVLNSARPESDEAGALAMELEQKYSAPVALVSCPMLSGDDISGILELVLGEFPLRRLDFRIPEWTTVLPDGHSAYKELEERILRIAEHSKKLGDISERSLIEADARLDRLDAGAGIGEITLEISDEDYYKTLGELTGLDASTKEKLLTLLMSLSEMKVKYEKIEDALKDANDKGYGIVMPSPEEMSLEEPRVVKTSNGYGAKISAHAEAIHMIKTGIHSEVCPMVGTEEQTEEVVRFLQKEFEDEPDGVWQSKIFGKSLYDLVKDGMNSKLEHMPDESRLKLGETIEKIINDGANGLICILL